MTVNTQIFSGYDTPAMANIRLPTNDSLIVERLIDRLLLSHRTFLANFKLDGKCYARISAQIYNELSDYDRMGDAVLTIIDQLTKKPTD